MVGEHEKRRTVVTVGEQYRVVRDAPSFPDGLGFNAGELLTLNSLGYSHYDSSFAYEFQTDTGTVKTYWLDDADPIEKLIGTFSR